MSLPNKGIQVWEWKWKEINEATWHDGKKMSGTVKVKGSIYDHSKSEITGPKI